jgi:hydrogenase nickel incorporation protein HypA/HybF
MHELAVCQGLMQQVEQVAQREQATKVCSITLLIGPLSGVEAALLRNAFPLTAAGTVAEDAELIIEQTPVRVLCTQCGAETSARVNKLVCGECGDFRTQVIQGEEMLLQSLVLDRAEAGEAYV